MKSLPDCTNTKVGPAMPCWVRPLRSFTTMTFDGQITANMLTVPFMRRRSSFKIQTRALKTTISEKRCKKSNRIDTWNKIRSTSKSNILFQVLFFVMIPKTWQIKFSQNMHSLKRQFLWYEILFQITMVATLPTFCNLNCLSELYVQQTITS